MNKCASSRVGTTTLLREEVTTYRLKYLKKFLIINRRYLSNISLLVFRAWGRRCLVPKATLFPPWNFLIFTNPIYLNGSISENRQINRLNLPLIPIFIASMMNMTQSIKKRMLFHFAKQSVSGKLCNGKMIN